MRPEALAYLACPDTGAALDLGPDPRIDPDGHVMAGTLVGQADGRRFAIEDGVPRLHPRSVDAVKVETARRFDDEWLHWKDLRDYYERQFLGWVAPLRPADFAGKVVFEGGCGKGRHTATVAGFGPKALVSLDLGRSALVAFEHTRHLANAHVVMGDLLHPPVRPVFDLAFSVGVIHHLPDPAEGFASLARVARDGGRVAIWVYGLENNGWIARVVGPVREALTARLPPGPLRHASAIPSAALWAAIRMFYKPRAGGRGPRLPYGDYFASMHDFPFDEIHSIVFDQLVTPVAHYLPGDEVRRWFADGFADPVVRWHNRYSWTGLGTVRRPGASAS
ncbi:methyltransferase domain-containing protein [Tundrisphaera sp. TA3]|uniref:methyltransferase domain-containing protein n=1 Tax=Tundrisphaera sp. TA3 TaxID=3435775 RepID=UPI003EBA4967